MPSGSVPQPPDAAEPMYDIVAAISQGGTVALIMALCIAVVVLWRRNEILREEAKTADNQHAAALAKINDERLADMREIANAVRANTVATDRLTDELINRPSGLPKGGRR